MLMDVCDISVRNAIEIAVVDSHAADYADWAMTSSARVGLYATAGEALQVSAIDPLLWIIHADLPDLSGFELHRQLRHRTRQATTILVSEQYELAQELTALSHGNLLYCPKPLNFSQFDCLWTNLMDRVSDNQMNTLDRYLSHR